MKVLNFRTKTREAIRASLATLDHENKYMPVGAKIPDKPAPRVLLEVPDGELFETRVGVNDYSYTVNSRSEQRARFHQYWFDGWRAEIDGRSVPLEKDGDGLCLLDIPPGVHDVRIRFARTPLHQAALLVSAGGWCAVLVFFAFAAVGRLLARRNAGDRYPLAPSIPPAG